MHWNDLLMFPLETKVSLNTPNQILNRLQKWTQNLHASYTECGRQSPEDWSIGQANPINFESYGMVKGIFLFCFCIIG